MVAEVSLMKLSSDECHKTLLMKSQHWFRLWLGAVRQQAITWANVDPDLCRQMVSLSLNELKINKDNNIWIWYNITAFQVLTQNETETRIFQAN